MLSADELRLLYTLARDYAFEDGAIVDGGCFLGGSTVALLAGLRDRQAQWHGPPLASFDRFRVEEYTIPHFFADEPSPRVGSSFRPRFEANVADFDVPHRVYEGDVLELGWSGEPIEVLFLDLDKSWKINDALLRDFFTSLVPGRSVIVHQDYGWGGMPWIPITMELLSDSVELIDGMKAGSHLFFVKRELPADVIQNGVGGLDYETQIELLGRATARAEGWARGMLELSRATLIAAHDGRLPALQDVARIAESYSDPYVLQCLQYIEDYIRVGSDVAEARHGERVASNQP
jgi:hypothetical protein